MKETEIINEFAQAYGGFHRNFLTPQVIRYGCIDESTYYELSEGTGISGQPIFGVTVAARDLEATVLHRLKGGAKPRNLMSIPRRDLSKMCTNLQEAETYIEELRNEKA